MSNLFINNNEQQGAIPPVITDPVTGIIENSERPALEEFRSSIGYTDLSETQQRGANDFYYRILSNSTGIEIQFTHTMDVFIIGNDGNRTQLDLNAGQLKNAKRIN